MLGAMIWLAALTVIVVIFIILLIILSRMRCNRLFELETQVYLAYLLQTFLRHCLQNTNPEKYWGRVAGQKCCIVPYWN